MVKVKIYKATVGGGFDEQVYTHKQGLISVSFSKDSVPILNGMMNEAVRASVTLLSDDFLEELSDTLYIDTGGVSYYDLLVYDDDVQMFRGVININDITLSYADSTVSIIAYDYVYLMSLIEDIESPTPLFSLGTYLEKFRWMLSVIFHRWYMVEFPELMSANNRYIEARLYRSSSTHYDSIVVDEGMLAHSRQVVDSNYNQIDRWTEYEFRQISFRLTNDYQDDRIKYKLQRRIVVLKIYNNICVDIEKNEQEDLPELYNSPDQAIAGIANIKETMPEYYRDSSWIGRTFSAYRIENYSLWWKGFLLPTTPIFEEGTSYVEMLKAYFLLHNLSFQFHPGNYKPTGYLENGTLEVVKNNRLSYTNLDVTKRLVDMEKTRLTPKKIELNALDTLRGDNKLLKEYLEKWYAGNFESVRQFGLVVDDLSNNNISLSDVIIAKGIPMKVMELQKNIAKDEYNITAWEVKDAETD